jgi:hypothetical protein
MPKRTATIESLPMAFAFVTAMRAEGREWGEGYRPLGRAAIARIIEGETAAAVDRHLEAMRFSSEALTAGLEKRFETLNVGFKPYPCCGSNHTSLDAVKELLTTLTDTQNP